MGGALTNAIICKGILLLESKEQLISGGSKFTKGGPHPPADLDRGVKILFDTGLDSQTWRHQWFEIVSLLIFPSPITNLRFDLSSFNCCTVLSISAPSLSTVDTYIKRRLSFLQLILKGLFHGIAHVQALALAVVNFTVSY